MKNIFVEKCKQIKDGQLSVEEFVSENLADTYVSISIKELVTKWIQDTILIQLGYSENEDRPFVERLCFKEKKIRDTELFMEYEVCKTLLVLKQYLSIDIHSFDYDAYDFAYETGIIDYVNKISKGDFARFIDYVDKGCQISSYSVTKASLNHFENLPSKDVLDEFTNSLKDIDPSLIQNLRSLLEFNNPQEAKINDSLKNAILSAVNDEFLQKEHENITEISQNKAEKEEKTVKA